MQQMHEHLTSSNVETVRPPSLLRRIGARLLKSVVGERAASVQTTSTEQEIQHEVHTGIGQLEEFLQESVPQPGRHSVDALGANAIAANHMAQFIKQREIDERVKEELHNKYARPDAEYNHVTGGEHLLFTHIYPEQGNPHAVPATPGAKLLAQYPLPEHYGKPPTQPQPK
ncbi:MAG TPA: hypothetical protein VLG40_02015 [Candidatus Saccharimonas sp.]|nr:hypothetical protein [Candidatus Saccharimonas sp.]